MDLETKVTALKQIGVGALVNQTLNKITELELRRLISIQENLTKDLAEFEKNGIELLEVTTIVPDNKAYMAGDPESTKNFLDLCRKFNVRPDSFHSFF